MRKSSLVVGAALGAAGGYALYYSAQKTNGWAALNLAEDAIEILIAILGLAMAIAGVFLVVSGVRAQ